MQSCSNRNCAAAHDHHLQDQLHFLTQRCATLTQKLQKKEKTIQSMQKQPQLLFPQLLHETMRDLHLLEKNQYVSSASDEPLSHSVISGMAHMRRDADIHIYEYEKQIADLYEEHQQERLKNEMLSKCLRDQKHAKARVMKAHQQVKQELQVVKESGLSQMLDDLEARCDALEKENAQITEKLLAERFLRKKQEEAQDILTKRLEDMVCQSTRWEGIVASKNEKLQQLHDQICEHQLTIDNLKADLRLENRNNTVRLREHCQEDEFDKIARLKYMIRVERAVLDKSRKRIDSILAENSMLRQQLVTIHESRLPMEHGAFCSAQGTFDGVLFQVSQIQSKLRALANMVKAYEEKNSIHISILDEGSKFQTSDTHDDIPRSCDEYAMQLAARLVEAARYLTELQEAVEDTCARLMGSSCALQ